MSLKFNSFRSDRYLRSKFLEGRYFLAQEATDLELEMLNQLRNAVRKTVGDVAIEDAWKVSRLSATQLLIAPGDAWFTGLPISMRSSSDQLVSGASLTLGIVPAGVSITDASNGSGKIVTFSTGSTPSETYRIVVSVEEQIITNVEDPFLKNANLTESTAQKIRLLFRLNIVDDSVQTETPIPYTSHVGTYDSANLVNKVIISPTAAGNGELLVTTPISGSEQIDGRNLELTIRNDSGIGAGQPIPFGTADQQAFSNGKLIDSVGNEYHINAIFPHTDADKVIIRLDKEVGQPNPQLTNGTTYTLIKRDVYYVDDTTGIPLGKIFWPIAIASWDDSDGFLHPSVVTDLRTRVISEESFENVINQKFNIQLTGGGVIDVDIDGETLNWSADFTLINPSGLSQTIAASSAVILDGGTLAYYMNLNGGPIAVGNLAVTVSSVLGNVVSLSGAPDLTTVKIGNVLKVGAESTAITAIDNINKTFTVSPAIVTTGSGTVYRDSFAESTVTLKENVFIVAARNSTRITVGGILELSAAESNAIYDVRTLFPSGLTSFTDIILPNNSITSKPQYYQTTKRNLEVYQNQLLKYQGSDWIAIDEQTIQFSYALPNDTEIHFRIDSLPAGSVGGGGSGGAGTLQEAYNGGNTISVNPGTPVSISGASGKLLEVLGDMKVTGVIDPAGMELTPQVSNPLAVSSAGIWVDASGQFMHTDGATEFNISQQIEDLEDGTTNPITAGSGLTRTVNDLSVNVDDLSIEIVADSLQIKDAGVSTDKLADDSVDEFKLNASVAGSGLSGGSGIPLEVVVDDSTLEIVGDSLQVKDAGITSFKLASDVAGDGLVGADGMAIAVGAGNGIQVDADSIQVLHAPSTKITAIAGESFLADVTYFIRWALTGETAGRVYKANASVASDQKYLAFGCFSSSVAVNAGDSITITTGGTQVLGSGDSVFSSGDVGKKLFLKNNGSGGVSVNAPTVVGDAQFNVGTIQSTTSFFVNIKQLEAVVPEPTYDERILYPSGLAANTDITLPVNSRNGDSVQTYDPNGGRLLVYANEILKFQDLDTPANGDWISIDDNTIQFNYALAEDTEVHFRIEALASGVLSSGPGGGSGTLQDAYDAGNAIVIASGVPLTLSGTPGEKLLVIAGDLQVDGVVDPTAIQLTAQASNPLEPGQMGIWVDNSGALMHEDGIGATNVTQVLLDVQAGTVVPYIAKSYVNNTGSTITPFTPVYSPIAGEIGPADGYDINKYRVIGVTIDNILNGEEGLIAIAGIVPGISATHNRYLFVGPTPGSVVETGPTLGGYSAGFNVVRLGTVEGTNLILQIQHMGTL